MMHSAAVFALAPKHLRLCMNALFQIGDQGRICCTCVSLVNHLYVHDMSYPLQLSHRNGKKSS